MPTSGRLTINSGLVSAPKRSGVISVGCDSVGLLRFDGDRDALAELTHSHDDLRGVVNALLYMASSGLAASAEGLPADGAEVLLGLARRRIAARHQP